MKPVVSIVIPTYKRPDFLAGALNSVIAQTFQSWEAIVVDDNGEGSDCSKRTAQVMARYAEDTRIRYITHPINKGAACARNTGIRQARGQFIGFLDDDDIWLPTKLEAQVARFEAVGQTTGVVYTGSIVVGPNRATVRTPAARGNVLFNCLDHNRIGNPGCVLCRRETLIDAGLFDENLPAREDIDLFIRLAKICAFEYVKQPLVIILEHEGERVTTNYGVHAQAHEIMYSKYRDLLDRSPRIHRIFLKRWARALVKGGDRAAARRVLAQAWKLNPLDLNAAIKLARLL